jgi:hypothetical protein
MSRNAAIELAYGSEHLVHEDDLPPNGNDQSLAKNDQNL